MGSLVHQALETHPLVLEIITRLGGLLLTLLAAVILLRVLRAGHDRVAERLRASIDPRDVNSAEQRHRIETVMRVGLDVARGFIWAFVAMTALGQVGVSVQPLVAGAGLAGAGLALGSQTIVKDFVAGFFILLEGHFVIGDTVALGPLSGTVEKMTLRVTLLRDVDGAVHIVPNGTIGTVTNKTYRWSQSLLTVGVPSSADQGQVREALSRAAEATAARDPSGEILLGEVQVSGPNNIRGTTVDWSLSVKVRIGEAARVKGWMVEQVVKHLSDAKIALAA